MQYDCVVLDASVPEIVTTKLLDTSMIMFNGPGFFCHCESLQLPHLDLTGCPMFNLPVCGDGPKHFNKTIAFEVYSLALMSYFNSTYGQLASISRVDQTVGFETGQPLPTLVPNLLEVVQTTLPTVKTNICGFETVLRRTVEQWAKVVIFTQVIMHFVVNTIPAGVDHHHSRVS